MDFNQAILSVSQVNTYIKSIIESDLRLTKVALKGEISNFTNHYKTGHFYFTLKDANSSIRAVMFKTSNMRLNFLPENGMAVIAFGRISVFERDGQYQIYVNDLQPDGAGALAIAFEQLKAKLSKEGLFNSELKKGIPKFVQKIGVITSPTGAAVQDILNVLNRRYPLADIVFAPVLVQGPAAASQIVLALEEMNNQNCCDVIILGRGGGSAEELWAFNDEELVRAVANSKIPVISAVGHETDFTLCDFAADIRAATPSAAAELAVPDIIDLQANLMKLRQVLYSQIRSKLTEEKGKLKALQENRQLKDPLFYINHQMQVLDFLQQNINSAIKNKLNKNTNEIKHIKSKLDALNPLKVLERGYAIVNFEDTSIKDISELKQGSKIDILMQSGSILATVNKINKTSK